MNKKYLVEIEDITNSHVPIESLPKETSSHCEESNQFMIHMYDQMFSTIDRSYKNIWEMILAIGGGIGVLQLYKCRTLQPIFDVAVIGYIIGLFWILLRLVDANYWCNRNLFIIHEIESKLLGNVAQILFKGFRPNCREKYNKYRFSIYLQTIFAGIILSTCYLSYIIYRYDFLCLRIGIILSWILIISIPIITIVIFYLVCRKRKSDFEKGIYHKRKMSYKEFIESLKKIGNSFEVPTLGFESKFLVKISSDFLTITTSGNNSHPFSEEEYNKILDRFINIPDDKRLKARWYSRPNRNTPEIGWQEEANNTYIHFFGYLPAVFRELLYREGISVCEDVNIFFIDKEIFKRSC